MSTIIQQTARTLNRDAVLVFFRFATNAASNPVTTTIGGPVLSVTHSGTGQYTVIFNDTFPSLYSAYVHLSMGAAANSFAQINSWTGTTNTLVLTTLTAGAAADIAAAANNIVYGCLVFDPDITNF
jgi:hypothetical protein